MVGGETLHVSVADTPAAREKGLSGKTGLAPDEGMLFVFPVAGVYSFWMKDMRFPIDILWIANDGTIVAIKENFSPASYPQTFAPATPARYVLEVPAGYCAAHQLQVGGRIQI
jgi:uncharacterized membrane protein (UPF0127 family)